MNPHTPNDFGVTSYIGFMKSLINHPDDVKVLRSKHILLDKLNSDEELAKIYMEISIPTVNNAFFIEVQEKIQEHYNSMAKRWIAQMISLYLSNPWTAIGLLAATLLLVLNFLQTYFTISPRSRKYLQGKEDSEEGDGMEANKGADSLANLGGPVNATQHLRQTFIS
ncbi:hypothetical protein RJ640_023594 [Escallonia rubra]|uniref:Uncharacterized protein n=1 Tax=Escallonia rubra TaxID=112253 RepID=A0AA88UBS2_9ASTE|nr:hypothetical protein RJ640_023594 [Escallonia rubra]